MLLEIIDNRVSVFPELQYIGKYPTKPSYIQSSWCPEKGQK